jgi:hypothetical protein
VPQISKPGAVVRAFDVWFAGLVGLPPESQPWYEDDYPEDTGLRESFRLFAEGGDLSVEYATAGCASARTPECANLIMDNLDAWAAWYEVNG